ncbi:glycine--tRNA ligase subunit beta [Litorilinea aerophila]|uniref:Multifunctional fusion protein n=1 Tax=Litorilinea aerophila TaxID=1204385 RepID=A0A540VJW3_9CHLR|nr:glycine--tRNA ligase subunit beta [Litorilinea aerophila]MCC9075533.1 glycine--tRNA ligase subunit beta [Litorilinea aerophila]
MSKRPTMQDVIMRLHEYWAAHGCLIWHPYSEKVGAGTMNPATVLRVLGPEPWNVAYVEPSFRADDGRYAENPNRMQMHNQYQVILKPDPGNPQELYLGSLEAIGLDRTRHDIRFVEDNWESPALGAWGLGWEVWLDGQEITQFTYFQQAGSLPLDPVSVEITYGLDRIVMYLQNKTDVWSIDVDDRHTYGELYRTPEIEHCIYNFELADVERLKTLFDIYQAEAQACIQRGLVIPAHDYVLRQSHTFNLLDARGAIGVTERAKFFAAMRSQARAIAELYVQQREQEEFPWLRENGQASRPTAPAAAPQDEAPAPTGPADFVLELGSEELPPHDVVDGIQQIQERLPDLLRRYRLDYHDLYVTGTPRRLVARVRGLAPRQQDELIEKRGPSVDRAFDDAGRPTRAAQGFARGQEVAVEDLEVRDGYVYAVRRVAGQPTLSVLPELCQELLDSLRWSKAMRWNSSGISYPRPLRWIVALYGQAVVPFTWAGVTSGRVSRAPRFVDAAARLQPGEFVTFSVADSAGYFDAVAQQGVVLDREERRQRIAHLVQETAASVGGVTPDDPDLLDEVTDLVEAPVAVLGHFDEASLELPEPVLISVMKKHQRYFPVVQASDAAGTTHLLPYFITIANSSHLAHPDVVRAGNEGVIRARYADAAYFYRQDTAQPLEHFTPRLATLTFHEKLGSMLDKVERLKALAPQIARQLGADEEQVETVRRAAALSKSDLVTAMVVEMTSLQGIMGEIYALRSGEPPAVAQAIREHYLPRFAGDENPASLPGLALSLADKLDSLAGLFAVGAVPTGSADPFGLRRAALGVVNNLLAAGQDFSIRQALEAAAALQPVEVSPEALAEVAQFVERRLQGILLEEGYAHDVVEAVLAVRGDNPTAARRACAALQALVEQPWWEETFVAYARCARITRNLEEQLPLNPDAYVEPVEHELHTAYLAAATALAEAPEPATVLGEQLRALRDPINAYFDRVLVNAEDETLRRARLALVQHIAALPQDVADLSKLQGF